ncbi:MAG: cation:proton antiporter domain-containing protein [Telluria sp.]
MNDKLFELAPWLFSPLAIVGAGLLLAQLLGQVLAARGLPKLYGAVIAGLVVGASGLGLVDAALLSQFQELFNAATALVLFEAGRKMDLQWLWRSKREGASLVAACLLRGLATFACLEAFGLPHGDAAFIAVLLIAASPIIFSSMAADSNASGTATFAGANMVGIGNVLALLALGPALAWIRVQDAGGAGFGAELAGQSVKLALGAAIAFACYGLYALSTRLTRAPARQRPGMLLAALLMDLGLCSVTSSSALLSLLLMGLLLRNAERRDNVFQAQVKTGQDIGYALLFMMSAALVEVNQLMNLATFGLAMLVFAVRIGVTRAALAGSVAWSVRKKNAMAMSTCSLVSFGTLMVDNSLGLYSGLGPVGAQVMASLLALNVLVAPALTWWGLKIAGETHEEEDYDRTR